MERPLLDPLQDRADAAAAFARTVVGEDDVAFVRMVRDSLNLADRFEVGITAPAVAAGPVGQVRGRPRPVQVSLDDDPLFATRAREIIVRNDRIIGGIPTEDFPDCVAVGTGEAWCCSGTLVGPARVVTAAHCVAGGCARRIFIGSDVNRPLAGRQIDVAQAIVHPAYHGTSPRADIAVLILAERAAVEPRAIAPASAIEVVATARIAGYGNTDVLSRTGYGRRRIVDVPVAHAHAAFGADLNTEFVAGAPFLDRDSCQGDSGGPAYVEDRGAWVLAGATSRAIEGSIRRCGDGGIYTRVGAYEGWVRSAGSAD